MKDNNSGKNSLLPKEKEEKILVDPYGRKVTGLRISITERCNLACMYCHNEGADCCTCGPLGHEMSPELICGIVREAEKFGVRKVKFSGGEPLFRKDFEEILACLPSLKEVSATTNGILLEKRAKTLKAAGLDRINVSLDSLVPEKYEAITGAPKGSLEKVIKGIDSAVEAGLTPVKLNMVLLKGINDNEIDAMMDFIRPYEGNVILQLIELMNIDPGLSKYTIDSKALEKSLEERASEVRVRHLHHRKKYIIDGVEVEFVRPMDNSEFCAHCSRLRITADGKFKPCLLVHDNLVDAREAKSPEEIEKLLRLAVSRRKPYCTPAIGIEIRKKTKENIKK
ncbi:molybdenum cofactor biosynthesis protein MoeA [Methanosarcina sp. 2.H.T.1A.6]|uniref:GTP 3',8-cyclase MoaA n=1 Tax=unclassified Methanosarcina TaxID=2644672 RepID=UPI000622963D|nr:MULTISPECIES: GTP 3',8-cyclase MoaA [unclassified Methanosarcina]KKG09629.1 molybdenum cofactor biosynthesis protein MoeA [Methanosarcina sp. 2.H.T.1A.15]KKG17281.1 molybdenum cofactor biosynthesis protein MoeA [Methanosarcina sp. 2.H.T.1A.3]KKG20480.1 molybdenum cofactor biosynthesis protein MoeA [Methanosarcina sp. 2.H.T.1A.6]KKG21331.1 molybdenum cofactor biosynthesis protein MoeA [Methanosarcina sp. 2.H.T.1A.8]